MVDLVQQLREGVEKKYSRESLETLLIWAADEIERLRRALDTLARSADTAELFLRKDYLGEAQSLRAHVTNARIALRLEN